VCWRVGKENLRNIIWHFEIDILKVVILKNFKMSILQNVKFQNVHLPKRQSFKISIFQNAYFSKCPLTKCRFFKMSNTQNPKFSVMFNSTYFQWLHLQIKKLSILEVQVLTIITTTTITGFTFPLHLGLIQKIIWKYLDNI